MSTPDTSNYFAVGRRSDGTVRIAWNSELDQPLHPDQALNLAAWLVAVVNDDARFEHFLREIRK